MTTLCALAAASVRPFSAVAQADAPAAAPVIQTNTANRPDSLPPDEAGCRIRANATEPKLKELPGEK